LKLAWRAFLRFQDHSGPDRAAAVAYYTLLSLLPMLIFMISLGVMVLGSAEAAFQGSLYLAHGVFVHVDPGTQATLRSFAEHSTRLQWGGLLLLAWTCRRAFASLFSALERVFEVPGRNFAHGNLMAFGMVLVMGAALLGTLAMTMVLATSEGLLLRVAGAPGAEAFRQLTSLVLTRLFPIAISFAFFFLLYRAVPGRVVGTRDAAVGAGLATVLWEGAKAAFAYYLRNLARYAAMYGALEGVIVLAIWLEISVSIILFCGEVVALRMGRTGFSGGLNRPSGEN
jgi:membrane protein